MADLPGPDLDAAYEVVRQLSATGSRAVRAVPTDVSDPQQIDRLHNAASDAFGMVNVLVNNAVSRVERGINADLTDWRRVMEVNVWAPIQTTRAFLPDMIASAHPGRRRSAGSATRH